MKWLKRHHLCVCEAEGHLPFGPACFLCCAITAKTDLKQLLLKGTERWWWRRHWRPALEVRGDCPRWDLMCWEGARSCLAAAGCWCRTTASVTSFSASISITLSITNLFNLRGFKKYPMKCNRCTVSANNISKWACKEKRRFPHSRATKESMKGKK